jgi:ribonuclease HIII
MPSQQVCPLRQKPRPTSTRCSMTSTLGDCMRVIGVDEAGRGPCIGPLFVGAFCLPKEDEHLLEELGATDSKRLRPAKREAMAVELRELGARRG